MDPTSTAGPYRVLRGEACLVRRGVGHHDADQSAIRTLSCTSTPFRGKLYTRDTAHPSLCRDEDGLVEQLADGLRERRVL